MIRAAVATVLDCYPRVFLACHQSHVKDSRGRRVLSAHQASVLDHLDAVEPTHLRDLAAHLGITASSASLMIDRLERTGFVRRAQDKRDARRVNLRLTRSGVRIKNQHKILDPSRVEAMLRRLDAAEREAAMAALRLLARAANELLAAGTIQHFQKGRTA